MFDATATVRRALDAAKAEGLTGWHLTRGVVDRLRPLIHKLDPDVPGDMRRLWDLADATRAVVWPESGHGEYARLSG
jgi:hypothetical protein